MNNLCILLATVVACMRQVIESDFDV